MEWIEVTARTLEDARELALDRLGVHDSELEVEILEEPRSGFLGVGRSDARIRARVKPVSREKPGERQRSRRRDRSSARRSGGGRGGERPAGGSGGGGGGRPPSGGDRSGGGASSSGSRRRRRRRRGSGRSPSGERPADRAGGDQERPGSAPAVDEGAATDAAGTRRDAAMGDVTLEDQATAAREFTEGLVAALALDAEVETDVVADDDAVELRVEGDDLGFLIGPRGVTLGALEELVRAVLLRTTAGHGARLRVDVGGYRARRRAALEDFAREVAADVLETGDERELEAMGATDRKIVHDTVAEIDGVETLSAGEEPRRRVVIRATG